MTDHLPTKPKKTHRTHSSEFKALVVALCNEPNTSRAADAKRFDLNDDLVHKWCVDARKNKLPTVAPDFIKLPAAPSASAHNTNQMIVIEYATANGQLKVAWPLAEIAQSVPWLKALGV